MSYFEFLIAFLLPPIILLIALDIYDHRRRRALPSDIDVEQPWRVILLMVVIAVLYTTPWDNYLVATNVWWYDPNLVTGILIGWVPIEEYTFFVLQTIFTGLLTFTLARYLPSPKTIFFPNYLKRWILTLGLLLLWIFSLFALINGWEAGAYLAILFIWAIPPIAIQLAFGADILWHFRRLVLLGIIIPTLYLAFADSLAISAGTWTINPAKSLTILIGSLPIEELIFFLTTNTLIVLGITLASSKQGRLRLNKILTFTRTVQKSDTGISSTP
jgi:lycopene cyclase domain-containing protein